MVAKLAAAVSWIALIALSLARTPVPDPPLGSHCSCERGICPLDSNGRRCSCGCAKRADAQPVQQLDAKAAQILNANRASARTLGWINYAAGSAAPGARTRSPAALLPRRPRALGGDLRRCRRYGSKRAGLDLESRPLNSRALNGSPLDENGSLSVSCSRRSSMTRMRLIAGNSACARSPAPASGRPLPSRIRPAGSTWRRVSSARSSRPIQARGAGPGQQGRGLASVDIRRSGWRRL